MQFLLQKLLLQQNFLELLVLEILVQTALLKLELNVLHFLSREQSSQKTLDDGKIKANQRSHSQLKH